MLYHTPQIKSVLKQTSLGTENKHPKKERCYTVTNIYDTETNIKRESDAIPYSTNKRSVLKQTSLPSIINKKGNAIPCVCFPTSPPTSVLKQTSNHSTRVRDAVP